MHKVDVAFDIDEWCRIEWMKEHYLVTSQDLIKKALDIMFDELKTQRELSKDSSIRTNRKHF